MKNNLFIIKSDIAALEISMNEDFNKFDYSDLSPNVLRTYNETGNRLIRFNNNIDDSITIIENVEVDRSHIDCPSIYDDPLYTPYIYHEIPGTLGGYYEERCPQKIAIYRENKDSWPWNY